MARTGAETEFTIAVLNGPVLSKEEELGGEECGNRQEVRPEEKQHAKRHGERDTPEREQIERAVFGAQPALRYPAADQCSGDSVDHRDGADGQAGIAHRHSD